MQELEQHLLAKNLTHDRNVPPWTGVSPFNIISYGYTYQLTHLQEQGLTTFTQVLDPLVYVYNLWAIVGSPSISYLLFSFKYLRNPNQEMEGDLVIVPQSFGDRPEFRIQIP